MKQLFQKPIFKNIISPVLRGLLKQVPVIGTPIAEVLSNLTQPKTVIATTAGGITDVKAGEAVLIDTPNKHNWVSIGTQAVCAVAILYAFYTKAITLQEVLSYMGFDCTVPVK